MRLVSKFYSILLHLGLWMFLLEVALVYECVFWRRQCKICKILPMSNFQSPSQWSVHFKSEIHYFVLASWIQDCWKLIVKKVCDNLSFSLKLYLWSSFLMHWSFALNPYSSVVMFCVGVLSWSFHGLSLSFSCVKVFMVFGHPFGWVKALHWGFQDFSQPFDALKLHVVQL